MSKRFAWLLGFTGLVLIALLVACGTTYNASSDGLVVVGSQGSALLESFSFNLANGHIAAVNNPPSSTSNQTCVLQGVPASIVIDPAGSYAYAIVSGNAVCGTPGSNTILAFKVGTDGTLTAAGSGVSDPNPTALAMDSSGKFLFVAEGLAGQVNSYSIGSGTLKAVPGTFSFTLPQGFQPPNFAALAPTPTTLPALVNGVQTAVCASPGNTAPTNEFLYVADSVNGAVYEFGVDTSTGALTNPPGQSSVQWVAAGSVPSGVAVDPCDRFVYVSNLQSNQISAYNICSLVVQGVCPAADGSLKPVSGSPFSQTIGLGPGPLVVDPFGNNLYVLETRSNQVVPFHISSVSGSLTAGSVAVTGNLPTSIAIRGDDQWLFVTNFNSATISQFSIIPSGGALSALPAVQTDNQPWGIAVK